VVPELVPVPIPVPIPVLILVEGESDRCAVEVVARRFGVDLQAERVEIAAMGGITNLPARLAVLPGGTRVTGLYDAAQRGYVLRSLARLGREEPFFACHEDLEDELIRALGVDRVLEVIEAAGDLASYQILTNQPFHRDRPRLDVLRRFMGTTSGRKLKYAGLLTEALDPGRTPRPLLDVLSQATRKDLRPGPRGRRR